MSDLLFKSEKLLNEFGDYIDMLLPKQIVGLTIRIMNLQLTDTEEEDLLCLLYKHPWHVALAVMEGLKR